MTTACCAGSFDPVTYGHLDVIERACRIFDSVVVGVLENPAKSHLFDVTERVDLVRECTSGFEGVVKVEAFSGLAVDFCRAVGADVLVKGLRLVSDFDAEMQQAQMNARMGVETVLMATNAHFGFISSSLMKEVVKYGGSITGLVPPAVEQRMLARLQSNS